MLIALDEHELTQAGHMAEDMFIRQMKRRRAALGLSQNDLADRIVGLGGNMYQQTIAKIESGQRALKLTEADVIASALETTFQEMLSGSIGKASDESYKELSTDDLRSQTLAARRREEGAATELDAALRELTEREDAAQSAQYEVMQARVRYERAMAYYRVQKDEANQMNKLLNERTYKPPIRVDQLLGDSKGGKSIEEE